MTVSGAVGEEPSLVLTSRGEGRRGAVRVLSRTGRARPGRLCRELVEAPGCSSRREWAVGAQLQLLSDVVCHGLGERGLPAHCGRVLAPAGARCGWPQGWGPLQKERGSRQVGVEGN